MNAEKMERVIQVLERQTKHFKVPVVTLVARTKQNPYKVMVSCILSLRTNDHTTVAATERLFRIAQTPEEMLRVPVKRLESIIFPVGFYRVKARVLHGVSREIIRRFEGQVPDELDDLLTLKGVGRKTANLVLTLGYRKPGICVDTHVHRISNRLGFVKTKTPEQTEFALRRRLPRRHWIQYNDLLVAYGQEVCRPVSPRCSSCQVRKFCGRIGVTVHR